MTDALIRIEGITKRFGSRDGETTVFENLHFSIEPGEFVCLIGHSGCGKTTILNILAGLDEASDGYVFVGGREVSGPSLDRAVIFQSHALLPWRTVVGNVAFAVASRWPRRTRADIEAHARRFIALVGLEGSEGKRPAELSGGMKQRVGIARAMASKPDLLLFDDPTTGLDPVIASSVDDEIVKLRDLEHVTSIFVTHQIRDAFYVARHEAVKNGGGIQIHDAATERARFLVLHEGRIYFEGSGAELLASHDAYLKEFLFMTLPPW